MSCWPTRTSTRSEPPRPLPDLVTGSRGGRDHDDGSAQHRSRVVAAVVVAAALLIVVAMAVQSRREGDGADTGSPVVGQLLAGMLTGTLVVCTIVAGVVWWIRLRHGRRPRPTADAPDPAPWWVRPLATLVALAMLTLLVTFLGRGPSLGGLAPDASTTNEPIPADDERSTGDGHSIGDNGPLAFLAGGFAALAVAAVLALAAMRGPTRPVGADEDEHGGDDPEDGSARPVAWALDASLADLSSEPDPRRAVLAAYARMEAVLESGGLPRRSTETSGEYCRRLLVRLGAGGDAATRLTALFERARYSDHRIDDAMRAEAIDAVHQVRDDLVVSR